ncbi:MAG: hypothetical protein KDD63_19745 [Bacteroidetes bacterium]|nr:hypothetical protein [Bacteroidota bacterium]MCB0854470.1 hypothetical protein [Bacteroidota bacterium]
MSQSNINFAQFYNELEKSLPNSTFAERRIWASVIIETEFELRELSRLLMAERKIASRFAWLLSDIAIQSPEALFRELPFLFKLKDKITHINFKTSFASYWLICGIPPENEGEAIDLLFHWLQSPKINVTTKSRALFSLFNLTQKYPELKNELKICLEDQMDKNTKDFEKRAKKMLQKLA